MSIKYITYEISSKCNMNCSFCFSEWRLKPDELSISEAKECIAILKQRGLRAINFTGGEPLMKKGIVEIINYAKSLGLITILSTNGILLDKYLPELYKSLDFIGLPLDSIDRNIHNAMRPTKCVSDHYKLVLDLIDKININYPYIGVKINTIVTKKNYETILGIGNLLKDKVVSWKLSHFISGGHGAKHDKEFNISISEYLNIISRCKNSYPGINLVSAIASERDDCCRILSTNGHILRPNKGKLMDEGRLLSINYDTLSKNFNQQKNDRVLHQTYLTKE
ncbi:MAG: radical SAM protein [Candidatus Woesearchaeota archaeon]